MITCDVIDFFADTWCSDEVPQIRMGQDVIHSTPIDPNNPLTEQVIAAPVAAGVAF